MVLGYSRKLYVEFTTSQSLADFLRRHVNAFKYFGGVVKNITGQIYSLTLDLKDWQIPNQDILQGDPDSRASTRLGGYEVVPAIEKALAQAVVDRITHRCQVVKIEGESYRGKGMNKE